MADKHIFQQHIHHSIFNIDSIQLDPIHRPNPNPNNNIHNIHKQLISERISKIIKETEENIIKLIKNST